MSLSVYADMLSFRPGSLVVLGTLVQGIELCDISFKTVYKSGCFIVWLGVIEMPFVWQSGPEILCQIENNYTNFEKSAFPMVSFLKIFLKPV